MNKKIYDVIIVGAGFSGCIAAKYLDQNLSVLLIDQNNLILKKFLMTGKGYSNITNTLAIDKFMNNIINNNKFMYSALTKYNSEHILTMCDQMHIKYFEKTPNRIHLIDSNEKFKECFLNELNVKANLTIKLNTKITSINHDGQYFIASSQNVEKYQSSKLIIAAGGMSFGKFTGSDGYGYILAKQFNHSINTTYPIGVGLNVNDSQVLKLQAASISDVTVSVYDQKNKIIYMETGDLMFTHYGIGGPVIRRVSGYVSQQLIDYNSVKIKLCFFNEKTILEELKKYRILNQCFKQSNPKILGYLFNKIKLDAFSETSNLNKAQIQQLVNILSNFELKIESTRDVAEAINTGGGINLKELDPSTFMSKLKNNLYFIGEIIDVNPRTNGFNLTICYASARIVADQINEELKM